MGHALGNNFGKFYSFLSKPVLLDLKFKVAPADTAGFGVTNVSGQGVKNVYMHTTATPATGNPNPAVGYALIELQYNYARLYSLFSNFSNIVTGSNLAINSTALTIGAPYVISAVGVGTAGTATIAPVADVSGSLTGTWFSLYDSYGNTFIIWFSVGGLGKAPTGVSGTLVQQTISTGATAAQIGTALATTIAGLPSGITNVFSFTATGTTTVTVVSTVTQPLSGPPADSLTAPTGFTFALTDYSTNLQDWQGVGLPKGVVPTIGASFIATATGYTTGGGSTGTVKTPGTSGLMTVEVIGDPNTEIGPIPMGGSPNVGSWILLSFLAPTVSGSAYDSPMIPTAPPTGAVFNAVFYLEQAARVGGNNE
jgi:hypothetical protein